MQSRIKKEVKKLGGEIMRDLHLVISYVLGDHCQKHCFCDDRSYSKVIRIRNYG
jgi:hypothetical protein